MPASAAAWARRWLRSYWTRLMSPLVAASVAAASIETSEIAPITAIIV